MTKPKPYLPYYNFNRLFSFNATYNFLVGGRGLGKTYGSVKKGIRDFIKNGDEFVYLRRYKSELVSAKMTFFSAVESEFKDYDFRVQGNTGEIAHASTRKEKKREWKTLCHFVSLSTAQSRKSVNYSHVSLIIYDEFIVETANQQYLRDEARVFNNFYSTVDRWKDKTRVLFLANSVSIANPYFIEYNIIPDDDERQEFVIKADGFICCHFPHSKEFQDAVYQTAFGKFIKDTEYADYSIGNQFADNNDRLIESKDGTSDYMFTLETRVGQFSVWKARSRGQYFIQKKLPGVNEFFTLIPENTDVGKRLLMYNDMPMKSLRTAFRHGRVKFDERNTRNGFIEIFRK